MAGVYIHIPFCGRRCHYCDFYSTANLIQKKDLLDTLAIEMIKQKDFLKNEEIKTVYFGGGTPSLLDSNEIRNLLEQLNSNFNISKNSEITLEVNPDDITEQYVKEIKNIGINRISIGVQSFFDEDLKMLNRRHDAKQAMASVKMAVDNGINNISIDLIYGLPGQSLEKWEENIRKAMSLPIVHLSAYHLTIEKGTAFYHMLKKQKIKETEEDNSIKMFQMIIELCKMNGFEHYEISNFAKNKKYSQHNSAYWEKKKYLGLGPSAHSYDGDNRHWNIADVNEYINKINAGKTWFEGEMLSEKDKMNEMIMTSLRTMWGLNLNEFEKIFGKSRSKTILKSIKNFLDDKSVEIIDNTVILTQKGKMISDYIIKELFF
jgi:oxygen-independent coproporphyrinogen III oxidase